MQNVARSPCAVNVERLNGVFTIDELDQVVLGVGDEAHADAGLRGGLGRHPCPRSERDEARERGIHVLHAQAEVPVAASQEGGRLVGCLKPRLRSFALEELDRETSFTDEERATDAEGGDLERVRFAQAEAVAVPGGLGAEIGDTQANVIKTNCIKLHAEHSSFTRRQPLSLNEERTCPDSTARSRSSPRDTTAFDDYLFSDMHMKNGTLEFYGVQGMKDHCAKIWPASNELLRVDQVVSDEDSVGIRMNTLFTADYGDANSLFGPVLAGETSEFNGVITYRLKDDRFRDILVAYNSFVYANAAGEQPDLGIPADGLCDRPVRPVAKVGIWCDGPRESARHAGHITSLRL
jgi:hypothetical protein